MKITGLYRKMNYVDKISIKLSHQRQVTPYNITMKQGTIKSDLYNRILQMLLRSAPLHPHLSPAPVWSAAAISLNTRHIDSKSSRDQGLDPYKLFIFVYCSFANTMRMKDHMMKTHTEKKGYTECGVG